MTGRSSPFRVWTGIGLAGLLCLISSLAFYDENMAYYRDTPDPWAVARQHKRLAALKSEIPADSFLGYYSDVPFSDTRAGVAFFAVAYTLAPRLLVDDLAQPQPDLVVGNFSKRPDLGQLARERGLTLVKDYGLGVMLFRQEKK